MDLHQSSLAFTLKNALLRPMAPKTQFAIMSQSCQPHLKESLRLFKLKISKKSCNINNVLFLFYLLASISNRHRTLILERFVGCDFVRKLVYPLTSFGARMDDGVYESTYLHSTIVYGDHSLCDECFAWCTAKRAGLKAEVDELIEGRLVTTTQVPKGLHRCEYDCEWCRSASISQCDILGHSRVFS